LNEEDQWFMGGKTKKGDLKKFVRRQIGGSSKKFWEGKKHIKKNKRNSKTAKKDAWGKRQAGGERLVEKKQTKGTCPPVRTKRWKGF